MGLSSKILRIILIFICFYGLINGLQFHLESNRNCIDNEKALARFVSMNNTIQNNKFRTYGELQFLETLFENDGILDFQFKQCPTDKTCGSVVPIQIKELCRYFTSKSIFGNRLGDNFTPQIRCPIKEGDYMFNLSINLKSLTKIPAAKIRTWVKLTVEENLQHNRKRPVACIEGVVSNK